ncbi:MAG: phosphotransferase [Candidatus Binatia bacterium]|nr:phosphotransferase [Candidatus Binatia bacterium]
MSLPDTPEAITPQWLTTALATSVPGVEVSSVEVVDRHSGTTGRARLRLEYASSTAGPETVFVKLPPFGAEQRQLVAVTDMGRREARFYESVAAETPMRVPRAYFAAHGDEKTEYIMVLEDLEANGCTFPEGWGEHARTHGQQLVEGLARVHAHFWEDARFASELSWIPRSSRGPMGAKLIDLARQSLGGDLPPVFTELCQLYVENHERIVDVWDDGESTLIHGDTHAGNHLVDAGQVGLYDWAVVTRSPGIRDVAIFLCNSCPGDVRRENQDEWIRAYHQGLVDGGVAAPDLETLQLRYRRTVLYGWVAATTTAAMGDRWQPIEVGMQATRRATEACDDLGTLDAFREAL